MRSRCSLLASTAFALLLSSPVHAQNANVAEDGAIFLLVPVGGRAAALGQAAVADFGSSEQVFWNPAGLASMRRGEVAVHHSQTFVSSNTALSAVIPTGSLGTIAFTAYLVDFGSQSVRQVSDGGVTGLFSPKNIELLGTYATRVIGDLSFGVNYKLIQFRQDCSGDCAQFPSITGTTHGVDLGLQYGVGGDDGPLRIGVALLHAGFKLQLENSDQADPLPTRLQYGIAYKLQLPVPDSTMQPLDARFLIDVQNDWDDLASYDVRVGVELGYGDLIRLRSGYASVNKLFENTDEETGARGPSVGIGVQLGRVSVDFSRIFFDSANFDEPVYIGIRADF